MSERHHYEGGESRNFATYNPQIARDQLFMIGRRETAKGGKIAPVRSTSALVLSSTNANREKIYVQQPPISASGYSSQAFNPHFAHTVRKTETKECEDCHLSKNNDNNEDKETDDNNDDNDDGRRQRQRRSRAWFSPMLSTVSTETSCDATPW